MAGSIRVVGKTSPGRRCVYCRGGAGDLRECEGCGALNHADCRAELGRCTSLGCQGLERPAPRGGAIAQPPGFFTPLWLTAAGHALLLVVTGGAALALVGLMATRHVSWFQSHGVTTGLLTLLAVGAPLALLFSLPWLWGARARFERARGLLQGPSPRAARLVIEERVVQTPRRPVLHRYLVLTASCGRRHELSLAGMIVPDWVHELPQQEVTLYGDTSDPMLVELSDGRLLLLFAG